MAADRTLQGQLKQCFETYKDNRAIEYGDKQASYEVLDQKSRYIANRIIRAGIQAGTFVGVLLEDKLELIAAIVGILRARCVFVPLDSDYPDKRIEQMLSASDLAYVLCDEDNSSRLHRISDSITTITVNEDFYSSDDGYFVREPDLEYGEKDKIYVYFTSGTTGRPKAILGKNIGLLQFIKWETGEFGIDSGFRVSQFTSQCHDPFLRDIFVPLCSGGTICIPERREIILNTGSLVKWIEDNKVDLIHCTPSLFKMFSGEGLSGNSFSRLKYVLLAGERVKATDLEEWYGIFNDRIALVNIYGPTETTLAKLFYRIKPEDVKKDNIPVGKPITGAKVIVLDKDMQVCGYGKTGEIYIRTPYRTHGYYKDDALNAERFIMNPFNNDPKDIIYKTGDLGRLNEDGDIEFLGRVDRQIKIRGFRVELNEIENALFGHELVKDAVVINIPMENGNNALYAYIVAENGADGKGQTIPEIKEYLKSRLPGYMIPLAFICLEKLPLNRNGKVDYEELARLGTKNAYEIVEPENETEESLREIWSEVLEVSNIGVENGFLDVGGHSLNAMKLIQKIYQQFKVEIQLEQIFHNPTIRELSNHIRNVEQSIYHSIPKTAEKEYYELSSAQRRMYVLNQFSREAVDYNMPLVLELEGELDKERLEKVFKALLERHESLRTSFVAIAGEPMQKIHEAVDFNIEYMELDGSCVEDAIQDFIRPFDLNKVPLIRASIVKLTHQPADKVENHRILPNQQHLLPIMPTHKMENRQILLNHQHLLMIDTHHIIADGTSRRILASELSRLYNGEELEALRIQYKDYAAWQNELLGSQELKRQEAYWLEKFQGEIPVLNMPSDYQRPAVKSFEGTSVDFKIDKDIANKLNSLARKNRATLYMVLLAAYKALLYRYTGQEDIVVGSPIAGRPHMDLQNVIGMFVNTLAMRNNPEGNKAFEDFLLEVKENALKAYENQDYQFEELVEKLELKRDMSRNPLFDTMLILQNMDTKPIELRGLKTSFYKFRDRISKFDTTLSAVETEEGIHFNLQYCTKLFKPESTERLIGHFVNLLRAVAQDPGLKLGDIEMVREEEKQQVLSDFNRTDYPYAKSKVVHELFEEQVGRTPDRIAAVCEDRKLTYRELNERSNQLARLLREKGIVADSIVGIMMERSIELVISVMGILKAGGALLPIDPKLPDARKKYMLENSATQVLLVKGGLQDNCIREFEGRIISVDDIALRRYETANPEGISGCDNLVYLIYTSGTTGNPKGVMLEHKNLANLVLFENEYTDMDFGSSKVAQFATMSFDACYQELFSTLLNGGELNIVSDKDKNDINLFLEFIEEKQLDILILPTAYLRYLSNDKSYLDRLSCKLKHIIVAGEQLIVTEELKKRLKENKLYLHNHYGPSETHVSSTYTIDPEKEIETIPPIGKPISNTRYYIFSKDGQLQPVGVPGELYIAGECVGRGYMNMPEVTKEKFLDDPFTMGERMYRTGDLARWLPDGNVEFLGRIDSQVKIRGYRIELGEIEGKLQKHEHIKEAAVVVKEAENGDKYLCSYIVPDREMTVGELRSYLSEELPEYMIPSYFVSLEKLPMTTNGKLDRRALPEPEGSINTGVEYEAPRDETEEILAAIWEEVLAIDRAGINDDFFELGGHSLKATVLTARIHKELGVEVPLQEVFKNPNIKGISDYIKRAKGSIYNSIGPAEVKDCYPLSSAQKRMYILNRLSEDSTNYNMPSILKIEGDRDIAQLEGCLKQLIKRHEALRTSFRQKEEGPVQEIHEDVDFKIEYGNNILLPDNALSAEGVKGELEKEIEDFIRPFNLGKAPLFRARLVKLPYSTTEQVENRQIPSNHQHLLLYKVENQQVLPNHQHLLMIDMHHIISDGVSMGILIKELKKLYRGEALEALRIEYKDYAVWQKEAAASEEMKKQEEYWLNKLSGEIPQLNLATDYKRPAVQSFEGGSVRFKADKELTAKLKGMARTSKATLYMVLLAAYNTLLYRYTGQEDIIIGTPIAGRAHADLQNIIGMFVNTLAMRNNPSGEKTFQTLLEEVKENALRAYENQGYQFEELVERLEIKRDINRNPLFDTMFTLQNMDMEEMEIEGVRISPYDHKLETSKFDISIVSEEGDGEIHFALQYCTKLFREETVKRLGGHYLNILKEIAEEPEKKLKEIKLLSEEEEQKLLDFNSTAAEYPRDKTVHELFEEQVEKTPENTAVVFEDDSLSYEELNQRANGLARVLREKGVKPETIVGIMAERSLELIVGTIAILKAGGAYLPIDPQHPRERIKFMLEDAKVNILLTQDKFRDKLEFSGETVSLEDKELYGNDGGNLHNETLPDNIIYIIYTSGTTGNPKGILTEHRNVVNFVQSFNNSLDLTREQCTLQQSAFTFDAFVEEVYAPLLSGGRVILPQNEQVKDVKSLRELVEKHGVTILSCSPFMLSQFNTLKPMKSVKTISSSTDALKKEYFSNIIKHSKVYNLYGPTEATVCTTYYACGDSDGVNIPVGRPFPNYMVYILDKDRNPVPIGVPGEIYISGDGISRGYLKNPELTEEKFMDNPFMPDKRMYRTGDRGRWLSQGDIEFLGRADSQVKIRGYRVEPGEIVSQLLGCEGVKEAVVVAREDEQLNKYLCAYFVSDRELTVGELRAQLDKGLPEYMVPAYFIKLEKIPLTLNGKLDKRALPEPGGSINTGTEYEAPRNEIEAVLVDLWQEVLKLSGRIGINDNFFELGGNSLKLVDLVNRINRKFQLELSLAEVFKATRIKDISRYIVDRYTEDTAASVVLLTKAGASKLFCFPPITGYGLVFNELSNILEDYALYAFNFVEAEDNIESYVKEIIRIQPQGPYVLVGYCLGGRLAFAVAKELERRGCEVSALIILDGYRQFEKNPPSQEAVRQYESNLSKRIEEDKKYVMFQEEILAKTIAYYKYCGELTDEGTINTKIHLIKASDVDPKNVSDNGWGGATTCEYNIYQGFGTHNEMLEGKFVEKNADIIADVLAKIIMDDKSQE